MFAEMDRLYVAVFGSMSDYEDGHVEHLTELRGLLGVGIWENRLEPGDLEVCARPFK